MKEKHIERIESKEIFYEGLEEFAREKIRAHLQDLLEQEVSEWLGREKSERKVNVLEQPGYRNGYAKPRRFTTSLGTVQIQRPRVRDLGERFKSKVLPMFKRQTMQVRDLIPELYLHGLASGDFELALRHLLGEGLHCQHRRYNGSRRNGGENTSNGRALRLKRRNGPICGPTGFTSKQGLARTRRRCWW
jgi:putative transposase